MVNIMLLCLPLGDNGQLQPLLIPSAADVNDEYAVVSIPKVPDCLQQRSVSTPHHQPTCLSVALLRKYKARLAGISIN